MGVAGGVVREEWDCITFEVESGLSTLVRKAENVSILAGTEWNGCRAVVDSKSINSTLFSHLSIKLKSTARVGGINISIPRSGSGYTGSFILSCLSLKR